jgi:hypothetical protein
MVLVAIALITLCGFIHYETLWRLTRILPKLSVKPRRAGVLVAVLGAMMSHLAQILVFALAFFGLGRMAGPALVESGATPGFADHLYFSMETYTSLGFGEMFPLRELRLLVGIESITGLVMISWTASFTYLEMQRLWGDLVPPKP